MVKTTTKEITERFDKDGKLIERITREETSEDDETRYPVVTRPPNHIFNEPYDPNNNPLIGETSSWCR